MKKSLVTVVAVVCVTVLPFLAGCGNKQEKELARSGGGDVGNVKPAAASSKSNAKMPSDQELAEIIKKGIRKGEFAELPLEITNVSVNWTDKSADSASGKFSAKTKTTEGLYNSISNKDGLKQLGITELYEGEVNVAKEKIEKLPEPYKTNLQNAVPDNKLSRFQFFEVLVPNGGEVTLTGIVELEKDGDNWRTSMKGNSISCGDDFVNESSIRAEGYKLDAPKTKEVVAAAMQERKDFVSKVNSTIEALENERLAALKKQKDDFDTLCKPGTKYKGSFRLESASGAVRVTFDDYATPDKDIVRGTISYLEYTHISFPFTVAVNTKEVSSYPVTGQLVIPSEGLTAVLRGYNWDNVPDYRLDNVPDYRTLHKMFHCKHITIRFADGKMVVGVGSSPNSNDVTFDMTPQ